MKLFSRNKQKDEIEYIAVIVLREDEGIGYLCGINKTKRSLDIIDETMFPYSNAWENLVYDIDELLFNFENAHSIEIKKATFFVYSHLIDHSTGELKVTYLSILKDVISENNLESLGYIELEESLAKVYSFTEQSPLNAVLIEVDNPAISAFVYQGGNKVFAHSVAKTNDIISDLEEIFGHTQKGALLPARILMYDSTDLESESHAILTHSWPENLFVQLPRVDVVRDYELKQAILLGVTEELFGSSIARQIAAMTMTPQESIPLEQPPVSEEPIESESIPSVEDDQHTQDDVQNDMQENEMEEESPRTGTVEETFSVEVEEDDEPESAGDMGFVIGQDVNTTSQQDGFIHDNGGSAAYASEEAVHDHGYDSGTPAMPMSPMQKIRSTIMTRMNVLRSSLSNLKMKGNNKQMLMMGAALVAVLAIVGGIVASLYFFHSATLTILYKPETLEETITLSDEIEFSESTKTFTVTASVETTGTLDVGEKASGEVTIFNADEDEKTFAAGTELKTSDGLTYVLDKAVTVEGATKSITDEGDVLATTSKATGSISAGEIGPKHNIAKDVKLSIGGFSDTTYFARTAEAISGGSSEQIQTPSRADFSKIDDLIEEEISKKSKESLKGMSEQGGIVDELTTIDKTDETYSSELGEEAETLEAEVTADVTFYSYDESAIRKIILEDFKDEVPKKYILSSKGITFTIASVERDEDSEEISIEIDAVGEPALDIDEDAVTETVKGSSLEAIRSDLESKFDAAGYEAEVQTPFPFLRSRLPWFSQNITVETQPLKK